MQSGNAVRLPEYFYSVNVWRVEGEDRRHFGSIAWIAFKESHQTLFQKASRLKNFLRSFASLGEILILLYVNENMIAENQYIESVCWLFVFTVNEMHSQCA